MIYAYDLWAQLPVKDLYDNLIMLASILTAKDMYEKGQLELKDFKTEYGDFISPILKDMDWYELNITGRVRRAVNYLYEHGIDPLRSAEGRSLIARTIAQAPTGMVNLMRQSAKAAEQYITNRGKLEAAGLYNPDFEERFLGYNLNNWDTATMGAWNRISPTEFKTLKDATETWFNNRTPGELTKEQLEKDFPDVKYDPRYKYAGYGYSNLLDVAGQNVPGWQGSVYADYYRDIARNQLIAAGTTDPTPAQVDAQLQRNIADAQREWIVPVTSTADQFAVMREQEAIQARREARAAARAAARSRGGGSGNGGRLSGLNLGSIGIELLGSGLLRFSGNSNPGVEGLLAAFRIARPNVKIDKINELVASLHTNPKSLVLKLRNKMITDRINMYLSAEPRYDDKFLESYTMAEAESGGMWQNRFNDNKSRFTNLKGPGVRYIAADDESRLYTRAEVVGNILFNGKTPYIRRDKTAYRPYIKDGSVMIQTGNVITAPMKDGSYEQFVEVTINGRVPMYYKIYKSKRVRLDENGFPLGGTGFNMLPDSDTEVRWSIMDRNLNTLAGFGQGPVKSGQGTIIVDSDEEEDPTISADQDILDRPD